MKALKFRKAKSDETWNMLSQFTTLTILLEAIPVSTAIEQR